MKHIWTYDRATKEFVDNFMMHDDADQTDIYEAILRRSKTDDKWSAMTTRADVDRNLIVEGL